MIRFTFLFPLVPGHGEQSIQHRTTFSGSIWHTNHPSVLTFNKPAACFTSECGQLLAKTPKLILRMVNNVGASGIPSVCFWQTWQTQRYWGKERWLKGRVLQFRKCEDLSQAVLTCPAKSTVLFREPFPGKVFSHPHDADVTTQS